MLFLQVTGTFTKKTRSLNTYILQKTNEGGFCKTYFAVLITTQYLINESRTLLDRTGYLLNLHMGILSTKMNKAMQRLAAISLIFLPLTFIVGNYGMNFKYMPELEWEYGYFGVWGVNIFIAALIFLWLKRKKWI